MLLDYLLADEPEAPSEFALVRVSRRAMATTFEVAVPVGAHADPIGAAEDALALVDELESQLTVFRDGSEVARLNAAAADGFVEVEPRLFELLARCAVWTKETGGAFDIATGALTKAWGFFRRAPGVPAAPELTVAMRQSGFRHVLLDADRRAVKFRVAGLELNLGAVGKGYALDRAAELLRTKWGVRSALLHAGGSSVYAIGAAPGDARGWPVGLKHPTKPGASLGVVHLRDAGLGTSAATYQHFAYNGRKLGHLLDPRRGWPATGTLSASVVAPTAAEADAMSTAAFVLGASGAEALTRLRPALGAVLLTDEPAPLLPARPAPGENSGAAPRGPDMLSARERSSSALPIPRGAGEPLLAFNLAPDTYSPQDPADGAP
ncbi:MAG TPA: FAD:protein FMN transferase [Gemmata sp.]